MTSDQHENLPPTGYVQALPVITHGDDIAEGIATIRLDPGSWPSVIRALNLIREDNGGPSWPPEASPVIAARWQPYLDRIDTAIFALADDRPAPEDADAIALIKENGYSYVDSELYVFCNGEHSIMATTAGRSPELTIASNFLSDFFERWTLYEDDNFDPTIARLDEANP